MTHADVPRGHIKIARKTFEADRWWLEPREFSKWEAWVDVIQLAAFKKGMYKTGGGVIALDRGEFVASRRWLAKRWGWAEKKVRVWLDACQKGARLRAQRETHAGELYLIVNYDSYQNPQREKGPAKGPAEGQGRAQQGPKIEAVKAVQAVTTKPLREMGAVNAVLEHYRQHHPRRRPGIKDIRAVEKALDSGYSVAELQDAITGNATDSWHAERHKHELSYVLRDNGKIDTFRDRAVTGREPLVDENGIPTSRGLSLLGGAA